MELLTETTGAPSLDVIWIAGGKHHQRSYILPSTILNNWSIISLRNASSQSSVISTAIVDGRTSSCMVATSLNRLKTPEFSRSFFQTSVRSSFTIFLALAIRNQRNRQREWPYSMNWRIILQSTLWSLHSVEMMSVSGRSTISALRCYSKQGLTSAGHY